MPTKAYTYIAIDVSKDTLQVQSADGAEQVDVNAASLKKLTGRLARLANPLVALEATGGYERPLLEALQSCGIPHCLLNPRRLRGFAQSEGLRAKSDPIDARLILKFAEEKRLDPTPEPSASQRELASWMDRRAHLSEQLTREKNRLQKAASPIARQIQTMIDVLKEQLAEVDEAIETIIQADQQMRLEAKAMQTVLGVGPVTTWTILAYLSEIRFLQRGPLTALAGLAPYNRDSGKKQGKRYIQGGRAKVRRCLYMAARTAAIHNPVIKAYVSRLVHERNKPFQCAITAAMRKLLLHLSSIVKNINYDLD
ncbi:transposase [Cerasicoccus frondis]|uniref:transposase n=1 Tax=Cerasicoccus frondis TaxID=490090 RepID=UPI0028524D0C|nr:transposase [Cerasicoccus frondis]